MPRLPASILILSASAAIALAADQPKPASPPALAPPESFTKEQREHWAYQPVKRPALPDTKLKDWARTPVDRFILDYLETAGIKPSPEADKVTLIRRVTFDLTGLPASPAEIEAFLLDNRADAYERLVEKLLGSSRYGERWAQHWLDLAHYADSNGFELDAERPDSWRYRDWVVKALNDDMPYDKFVKMQIAGDEYAPGDKTALIATGFGRCGPREVVGGNIDPEVKRQSELSEVTGTVGSVFLGLTMACARCHDHKFDAIPSTDYYRLQSFFAGSQLVDVPISDKAEEEDFKAKTKAIKDKIAPLRAEMAKIEAPYRAKLKVEKESMLTPAEKGLMSIPDKDRTPAQKKILEGLKSSLRITWEDVAEAVSKNPKDHAAREDLKRRIDLIERTEPAPPAKAMALIEEKPSTPDTFVLKRGDVKNKASKVMPRPPGVVLVSQPKDSFSDSISGTPKSSKRRTALAEWLTRPDNPLTARVMVNRIWQHHFGRGIVVTPSDFGVRGESPSHPELLDFLADEFVSKGWKLKQLHKLIVTSAVYRQSHADREDARKIDPDNSLLWRMNRRRMDAEGLRDAMLFASGELNPKMGGPGVKPPIEKEIEDLIFTEAEVVHLWPETLDKSEHTRRSLYLFRKRNVRYPMFDAFDSPDTQSACPQRSVSTHALQALVMLNSDFADARAKAMAKRLTKEGKDRDGQIQRAYMITLGRNPSESELNQARNFIAKQAADLKAAPEADQTALADFCLAMLNRTDFVYNP